MKTRLMIICMLFVGVLLGCTVTDEGYLIIKTADPSQDITVKVFQPSLLPTVTPGSDMSPEVIPAEEVGELEPDPIPEPPCELIKGNISSSGEKIYHVQTGAYYEQVKIDESKGESFSCSEQRKQLV